MTRLPPPCSKSVSGRLVPIIDPAPDQIDFSDIAESLAKQGRFNGHTFPFYSVAQHCCLVCDNMPPDFRIYGLLHDAHESLTGDIILPMKQAVRMLGGGDVIQRIEEGIDRAIYAAAGVAVPWKFETTAKAIREADARALATEERDLRAGPALAGGPPSLPPFPRPITPWPWPTAMQAWLERFDLYAPAPRTVKGGL